jgi:hypothetical protein
MLAVSNVPRALHSIHVVSFSFVSCTTHDVGSGLQSGKKPTAQPTHAAMAVMQSPPEVHLAASENDRVAGCRVCGIRTGDPAVGGLIAYGIHADVPSARCPVLGHRSCNIGR